jgi:hypothetical protein
MIIDYNYNNELFQHCIARARARELDISTYSIRDQSFARPIVSSIQTRSTMNMLRCKITTTSQYCGLVTEAALDGMSACASSRRDRTLRNINILADGVHWRLPKCPDGGASADQVPADYGGRRNHPCVDCRCCVYYAGGGRTVRRERKLIAVQEESKKDEEIGIGIDGGGGGGGGGDDGVDGERSESPPHWFARD